MKIIGLNFAIIIILLTFFRPASAWSYTEEEYKRYIEKLGMCDFAFVAKIDANLGKRNPGMIDYNALKQMHGMLFDQFYCLANWTIYKNTIREASGCFLLKIKPANSIPLPAWSDDDRNHIFVRGEKCSPKLFEKIIEDRVWRQDDFEASIKHMEQVGASPQDIQIAKSQYKDSPTVQELFIDNLGMADMYPLVDSSNSLITRMIGKLLGRKTYTEVLLEKLSNINRVFNGGGEKNYRDFRMFKECPPNDVNTCLKSASKYLAEGNRAMAAGYAKFACEEMKEEMGCKVLADLQQKFNLK